MSQRPRILSSLCIFLETEQWHQRASLRGHLSVCILSPPAWSQSQTNCKQAAGGTKMVPLTSPRVRPELLCEVWSECTPDLTCALVNTRTLRRVGAGCPSVGLISSYIGPVGLWACGQCRTRQLSPCISLLPSPTKPSLANYHPPQIIVDCHCHHPDLLPFQGVLYLPSMMASTTY